jgi:secondary thiamine-phosphate synthase enzyme
MFQKEFFCQTSGEEEIVDITGPVRDLIIESGISNGLCSVFVMGSTAAITTIEYEEGVLRDLNRALSILAPSNADYAHDARWGDGNGRSHVKAALVGPSLSIPVRERNPVLGTWQQIVLLELDIRTKRERRIMVTIFGE